MENSSSQTVWHTSESESNSSSNQTPPPPPKKKPRTSGTSARILGIVLLVVIGAVVLYSSRGWILGLFRRAPSPATTTELQPTPTSTVEIIQQDGCTLEAKICPDGTSVGRSGPNCEFSPCPNSTLTADTATTTTLQGQGFTLRYPASFTLKEEPVGTYVLTRVGPTQSLNTELFDGTALIIRWHDLQGRSLENFVDHQIAAAGLDGISVIVRGRQPVTIGQYNGYSYVLEGLGTYTKSFIMKDSASQVLQLEYLVEDPTNLGFQQQINQIMSSINLE